MSPDRPADLLRAARQATALRPTEGVVGLLADFVAELAAEVGRLRRVLRCEYCAAAEAGGPHADFSAVGPARGGLHRLAAAHGREVVVPCWAGHPREEGRRAA